MKRLGLLAFAAAVFAPILAQADPWYVSEGWYYGGSPPTAVSGKTYPAALDSSLNLQVDCVTGCSGSSGGASGGYYNPSPTPFPTATAAPALLDAYGETLVGPGPHASPFPVAAGQFARTDTAGSITSGGTAQNWATAGAIVHGCDIMNTSTAPEYIRLDGTAASTASLYLSPNGYYECPLSGAPTTAVSIYGATTGQTFFDEVW